MSEHATPISPPVPKWVLAVVMVAFFGCTVLDTYTLSAAKANYFQKGYDTGKMVEACRFMIVGLRSGKIDTDSVSIKLDADCRGFLRSVGRPFKGSHDDS